MAPISKFVSRFIPTVRLVADKAVTWHRYHKMTLTKSRRSKEVKDAAHQAKGKLFKELSHEHFIPVETHKDRLAVYALKGAGWPWKTTYVHPDGNKLVISELRRTAQTRGLKMLFAPPSIRID